MTTPDSPLFPPSIGVDVGGTKIATGVLIGDELHGRHVQPTPETGWEAVLDAVAAQVRALQAQYGQASRVGVGVPGPLAEGRTRVKFAPNIYGFTDVPLVQGLQDRLGLRVERLAGVAHGATRKVEGGAQGVRREPLEAAAVLARGQAQVREVVAHDETAERDLVALGKARLVPEAGIEALLHELLRDHEREVAGVGPILPEGTGEVVGPLRLARRAALPWGHRR